MALYSRIPQIIAKVEVGGDLVARESAENVKERAQVNAAKDTGDMADSIDVRKIGDNTYEVYVGEHYGIFVENGTTSMSPQPFMTPAAEAERGPFEMALRALVR